MNAITGTWDVALKTPIGTLSVQYRFEETAEGLRGTATGKDETVPLSDIESTPTDDGATHFTWQQKVSKPMRLNLDFDVVVNGNELAGHSRAGRLPRTRVTGHRIPA